MEDITTVVELSIEPTELYEVIQSWATEEKFSVYEKNEKRTIYSKNIRVFNTAWLLIENQGESAKINAWLAPKGLKPDAKGSTWSGRKIAIPNGFAMGPVSIYKKQFNKLMEMLKSKSNNIVMRKSNQNEGQNQPKEKEGYVKGLAFIGIIEFLLGMISAISASTFISSYPEVGNVSLKNGIFNMVLGVLTFICSRMLKNGKVLAIWLYSATILLNVAYEISMGHKLPYFSILFGAIITWQLLILKKKWKLS
jgi:hypothetical protein